MTFLVIVFGLLRPRDSLNAIQVALTYDSALSEVDVWLITDASRLPDAVIETFHSIQIRIKRPSASSGLPHHQPRHCN